MCDAERMNPFPTDLWDYIVGRGLAPALRGRFWIVHVGTGVPDGPQVSWPPLGGKRMPQIFDLVGRAYTEKGCLRSRLGERVQVFLSLRLFASQKSTSLVRGGL